MQRMLNLVGKLGKHRVGNVGGALRDEIQTNAFGTDQLDNLLYLLQECLGHSVKEQMCFIEEENKSRLLRIADFRHILEEFIQQPQHENRVHGRMQEELRRVEDIDITSAGKIKLEPVLNLQRRLAEEKIASVILQNKNNAEQGTEALRTHIAVYRDKLVAVSGHILNQTDQILDIQKEQTLIVRDAEDRIQYAGLHVRQLHQTGQQKRPHIGYRRTDRVAFLTVQIPITDRKRLIGKIRNAERGQAFVESFAGSTGQAHTGQISLHISQEHRNAHFAEGFRKHFQTDGLTGTGSACDQSMAVSHPRQQIAGILPASDPDSVSGKHYFCRSSRSAASGALSSAGAASMLSISSTGAEGAVG